MAEKSPLEKLREKWSANAKKLLVGRRIEQARYVPDEGNRSATLQLILDDGTEVFVQSDDEGNGPGALHVYPPHARPMRLLPQL